MIPLSPFYNRLSYVKSIIDLDLFDFYFLDEMLLFICEKYNCKQKYFEISRCRRLCTSGHDAFLNFNIIFIVLFINLDFVGDMWIVGVHEEEIQALWQN